MKEIGGYLEFPQFTGKIMHGNAIALNCARSCLAYLIEVKQIKKILLPKLLCGTIEQVCRQYDIKVRYYSVGVDFLPCDLNVNDDEWLYLVNYYGQISNEKIARYKRSYDNLIVDNVQAYFQHPVDGVDTLYTCRKFFGVSDGAFLYTDKRIERELSRDKSAERMMHLLGRYEDSANKYYSIYKENEKNLEEIPIRKMSRLTENVLRGIDYNFVARVRRENYSYLRERFAGANLLDVEIPDGAFMFPLYLKNGSVIRKDLVKKKVYIPLFWEKVFDICNIEEQEYDMAKNILPLPVDQRYTIKDMEYVANIIQMCL